MMNVQWCDRTVVKENFGIWRECSNPFMLVQVFDTQEMQDIKKWIEQNAEPYLPVMISYPSDYPILKNELLKELTDELVGIDKFPDFNKEYNKDIHQLIPQIKQGVAEYASSNGAIEASSITQQAAIQISPLPSLEELRERNIQKLLDYFLQDFKKSCCSLQTLFVFQFKKLGFKSFTPDFKRWFHKFCKTLSQGGLGGRIKFCILNQGDLNELLELDTDYIETVYEELTFEDILNETDNEDFCYGVINPDKNSVKYSEFKRKMVLWKKKRNTKN